MTIIGKGRTALFTHAHDKTNNMVTKLAWIFAAIFLVIGVLGFVPGITSDGMLLGIFMVGMMHNLVHIVSGALLAYAAWKGASLSRLMFKVLGVVYAVVAVLGFFSGDTVLGLIAVNMADNVLHIVLAAVFLYAGFMLKGSAVPAMGGASSAAPQSPMGGDMQGSPDSSGQPQM